MDQFLEAFSLGNAAILGNVCMLPLYPGLFVLFANQRADGRPARWTKWMGLLVLAGVVVSMVAIGLVLHLVSRSVADILDWLLPVMYGLVLVLGVAMVLGRNPFARLATTQVPILRSPAATAFVYGMLMAPLTLPCTGPLVISAFVDRRGERGRRAVRVVALLRVVRPRVRLAAGAAAVARRAEAAGDHPVPRPPPPGDHRSCPACCWSGSPWSGYWSDVRPSL